MRYEQSLSTRTRRPIHWIVVLRVQTLHVPSPHLQPIAAISHCPATKQIEKSEHSRTVSHQTCYPNRSSARAHTWLSLPGINFQTSCVVDPHQTKFVRTNLPPSIKDIVPQDQGQFGTCTSVVEKLRFSCSSANTWRFFRARVTTRDRRSAGLVSVKEDIRSSFVDLQSSEEGRKAQSRFTKFANSRG